MDILISLSLRAAHSRLEGWLLTPLGLFFIPLASAERRWRFLSRITLNSSTTRAEIILRSATLP